MQWFAAVVERSAELTTGIVAQTQQITDQWHHQTSSLRRDSAARVLLAHLAGHPVVNSADVADLLGVSERTGRTALETLAEHSVLTEIEVRTGQVGRARRWYAAESLTRLWGPTGR